MAARDEPENEFAFGDDMFVETACYRCSDTIKSSEEMAMDGRNACQVWCKTGHRYVRDTAKSVGGKDAIANIDQYAAENRSKYAYECMDLHVPRDRRRGPMQKAAATARSNGVHELVM